MMLSEIQEKQQILKQQGMLLYYVLNYVLQHFHN